MNSQTIGRYAMQYLLESQTTKQRPEGPSQAVAISTPVQEPRRWWSRRPRPEDILTKEERKILKSVKSRAHFLDRGFSCCCIQIGFDGLIGLIPVVGDFVGLIFAMFLVEKAMEAHLPSKLINQMLINVAVDFFIGLVPIIGDILDIMYKCNTRNALLLEEYLIQRRQYQLRKQDVDNTIIPKATSSATNIHRGKDDEHLQSLTASKSTTAVELPPKEPIRKKTKIKRSLTCEAVSFSSPRRNGYNNDPQTCLKMPPAPTAPRYPKTTTISSWDVTKKDHVWLDPGSGLCCSVHVKELKYLEYLPSVPLDEDLE